MHYYISATIGYYEGDKADPSDKEVPQRPDYTYSWVNGAWALDQSRVTARNKQLRAQAYKERSDPLFFKFQRGDIAKQAWLDEVAAIKAEFP